MTSNLSLLPSLDLLPIGEMVSPYVEALLRGYAGLALVPHGLRTILPPAESAKVGGLQRLVTELAEKGYKPPLFWARAIVSTELIAGPLLAAGLFTRVASFPIILFLLVCNLNGWRTGGFFWDTRGLEYTTMWTLVALYFFVRGGGVFSLDRFLLGLFS